MALQLEGEIAKEETKTFVIEATRREEKPRLAAWVKSAQSEWSSEPRLLNGLFLTSFQIAGKEQLKREAPLMAFSTADGIPTFVRFKVDVPEGAEVVFEVKNRTKGPRTFAIDLHGIGGPGSFTGPEDIADAMFPFLAKHVAGCTDRRCKGSHVGEPLCPAAAKIVEWLRAETFLQRLQYALEAGRTARG